MGELLFEGYADEVMELGESMMEEAGEYEEYSQYGDNGDQLEEQSSTNPNLDKFGWFYKVHCYVCLACNVSLQTNRPFSK